VVTRNNVGYRQDLVPCAEDASDSERRVPGPLHLPAQVLPVLGGGASKVLLWTRDCARDVQYKLEWDTTDVHQLLGEAVTRGRFIGSEWCSQRPTGPSAACDAYSIVRVKWNQFAKRSLSTEYYVKFALSKNGANILVVSCHV
jgi:hypothetical protein